MNCIYEMNSSEQEMRAEPQYHTNGYTTLTSPYSAPQQQQATPNNSLIKMDSSQIVANNSSDSIKQSSELLMVSILTRTFECFQLSHCTCSSLDLARLVYMYSIRLLRVFYIRHRGSCFQVGAHYGCFRNH